MKKKTIFCLFLLCLLLGGGVCVCAQEAENATADNFLTDYQEPVPLMPADSPATFMATLFRFAFSLVVIIVLIYLTIHILRIVASKYRPAGFMQMGIFEVLDSLVLGPNKTIYLLSVNGKRILIVFTSDKEISVLDKIEDSQQVSEIIGKIREKWGKTDTFSRHLEAAQKKRVAREYLKSTISNLTGFMRSFKRRS